MSNIDDHHDRVSSQQMNRNFKQNKLQNHVASVQRSRAQTETIEPTYKINVNTNNETHKNKITKYKV
jgi:hypothetical protein